MNNDDLVLRAGSTAHDDYALDVTPERAGWAFSGLKVVQHRGAASTTIDTGPDELLVLPLEGGCEVRLDGGETYRLTGRPGVFAAITDYLYVPRDSTVELRSDGGRFALPTARAARRLPATYCPATQVRTELRGAGASSRQVNNYALANELETDHLLCCEVLTPGGCWSSYPPHKHDEFSDVERELEEIYYFEVKPGPDGPGFAFQAIYAAPERPISVCTEVRDRDLVLVPHGYHGPSMAPPGYDLYYLNVMAGPAEDRRWLMTDDPAHHWIRESWADQVLDPRLPMTAVPTGDAR